jgi:diaminopimelate decarboxylase
MMRPSVLKEFGKHETPFYYYDLRLLRENIAALQTALAAHQDFRVHYALKANFDEKVLRIISAAGLGADCVSGGEVQRALDTGFAPSKIVFAGVGKSDKELQLGISTGIGSFNVESVQELQVLAQMAASVGRRISVSLRLNPNVNANTHAYITTGLQENKFGIPMHELFHALDLIGDTEFLDFEGLHFHIGSQITDLEPFKNLCNRANNLLRELADRSWVPRSVNVGGGLGVDYKNPETIPDYPPYFAVFASMLDRRPGQEVHFELGRAIVAQMGTLVSRVLYTKRGEQVNFLILDAGMTELIRPALYQAYHKIENLSRQWLHDIDYERYDVVGPICESSDTFGKSVKLPVSERGDYIGIKSTGAYGAVMRSTYNLRPEPKVVYEE